MNNFKGKNNLKRIKMKNILKKYLLNKMFFR